MKHFYEHVIQPNPRNELNALFSNWFRIKWMMHIFLLGIQLQRFNQFDAL